MESIKEQVKKQTQEATKSSSKSKIGNKIDLDKALERFLTKAEEFIPGYVLDEKNKPVITQLLCYFGQDQRFNGDLGKGLIIMGNVGVGKSKIMEILSSLLARPGDNTGFSFASCREVSRLFSIEGFSSVSRFGSESFIMRPGGGFDKTKPLSRCFDDFGAEGDAYHYGNKVNVMEEILQDRYEAFGRYGMRTYITTNLNEEEIEGAYGTRVISRLREMCNFLVLKGQDRRK